MDPSRFFYVYNYTDHLGNVRMSYTNNGAGVPKILEESHYYPFGLKHENYASERFEFIKEPHGTLYVIQPTERREWQYKYNGKEWQDELGLNFYDYGARNYDAAIGRWMNVDPLAEKDRRWTPYKYCYNNPLRFVDPDGMGEFEPTKSGDLIIEEGDTEEKLLKQYGAKIDWSKADKGFNFSPGQKIIMNNAETRAIDRSQGGTVEEINSGKRQQDIKNDNYVCDEAAQMANAGMEITPKNAEKFGQFPDPSKIDETPGYSQVKSLEGIKKGEGIISIGGEHTGSYYGTSNDGTVYVFNKAGRESAPSVMPLNQVIVDYNKDQGTNFTNNNLTYFKKDGKH